jgi:phosphoglycolate phosphatase
MNLLFDLDGTLADPFDAFASSLDFAYDSLGLARLSRETVRSLIGPPLHLELPALLGPEKSALAAEVMKLYRQHHNDGSIYQYRFYDGVDEALRSLKSKHRLFVATSKPKVYADEILRYFGKAQYFEFIFGSELSGVNSQKGDLIRFALEQRSLSAGETTMIGDRKYDVIGARSNGIPCVGVAWGYGSRDELVAAGARAVVGDWPELLAQITS